MALARTAATVVDCPDPHVLATFYAAILGWELEPATGGWAKLRSERGQQLHFQPAPDHRPPDWPAGAIPAQFHLDLTVDDLDLAEVQVLALGATRPDFQPGVTFRVFLDPAGHPFCLCQS